MRQILLLIGFVFASVYTWAYSPMDEEGNPWTVINLNADCVPDGEVKVTTVVQKIADDSICDDVSYKRLVISSDKDQNAWSLHALLREATRGCG